MTVALAVLIGGVIAAAIVFIARKRVSKPKPPEADAISATTGSNRTLTGTHSSNATSTMSWNDALRRLVAYALDDAPREALSQPPNPDHAPVFQAVQQVLGSSPVAV